MPLTTDEQASPTGCDGPTGARRVLVTGGAGYIGSHLSRLLLQRGYHVRVLDRLDYGRHGIEDLLRDPRFELFEGDVCHRDDVRLAVRGADGVFALAAIVGDPACDLDPDATVSLNFEATRTLLDACESLGTRRLVFASSCSVYGAQAQSSTLTEEARTHPVSLYARTRLKSERMLLAHRGRVEVTILRLATVFGLSPRMRFDLVVNALTAQAAVEGRIHIEGGGQSRPLVHCRDASLAFVLAFEAPAHAVAGQVFNVGGDELNHRVEEIGVAVAGVVPGVRISLVPDELDPRTYRVSSRKASSTLGFRPSRSLTDGIREIVAALEAEPALRRHEDDIYHNVRALGHSRGRPHRPHQRTRHNPAPASS